MPSLTDLTPATEAEMKMATVPIVPTEAQWGGLARAIMMWLDFDRKTPRTLFRHLKSIGVAVPKWLAEEYEMTLLDHVPSKGTRCTIIYRAMIEDHLKDNNHAG